MLGATPPDPDREVAPPPPWPKKDIPEQVGFTRQKMVRWLSPGELVNAGIRAVLSGIFGVYSDKRELQAALAQAEIHRCVGDDLWLDFVADLGDGFDATYTVAALLAREHLDVATPEGGIAGTRRGQVLVMGGDQVYPTADIRSYENRFKGPYRAALPHTGSDHPLLFALPGNHDWYDGLTSFMRLFCQRGWIGGWETQQTRSYFALQLPHRWWLWGIDIQFDTYLDAPQLSFFNSVVAPEVEPGDSIILCSSKPNWAEAAETPEAFTTLDYFERELIRKRCQAHLRLSLSGDSHHYARYRGLADGDQRLTWGGGGAFLSATHHLAQELELPPPASTDPGKSSPVQRYRLEHRYPQESTSKGVRWGIWRLPLLNPSFAALTAVVYLLFAWSIQAGQSRTQLDSALDTLSYWDILARMVRSPIAFLAGAGLVFGLSGFTKATPKWKRFVVGIPHSAVHLAAISLVNWVIATLLEGTEGLLFSILFVTLGLLGGAVLGSAAMALYLFVADHFGLNTNELFAAQRIEDRKGFLRLHLTRDGLEIFPIAVDKVGHRWRLRRESVSGGKGPWFEADKPSSPPRLLEAVICLAPEGPAVSPDEQA
ncbi:MAG: metallophosphoesterase [Acidimicrobiia bacterium]